MCYNIKKSMKVFRLTMAVTMTWCFLLTGCQHPYREKVKEELASGIRYDSLFLGVSLGMERKAFYDTCWKLNKRGLVMQGPSNMSVEYRTKDLLKYPALMRFYPGFYENKIYEVPATFSYEAWAPWNKQLSADSLVEDVKDLMDKWYGKGYIEIDQKDGKKAFVKVNGNRRISIYKVSDQYVHAVFTDLTKEEAAEAWIAEQNKQSK